jgi:hypothetical protein
MLRFVISIAVVFLISLSVFFFFLPIEVYILEVYWDVSPKIGVRQPMWLDNFLSIGLYALGLAILFTLFWNAFGYLYFRITRWSDAGGLGWWVAIFAALLLILVFGGYNLNLETQDFGRHLAATFYAINGALIFWISSLLQPASPPVKFVPIGSKQIRKISVLRRALS